MKTPAYINSNLTPREVFRLYGALPDSMIETLLDVQDAADNTSGVEPYITEALGCYPSEDFIDASGVFEELRAVARSVRGDNKAAILAIIEKLEALQTDQVNGQTEYGRDELRKALEVINAF